MADCTKTVEFMREWLRLCKNHICDTCPLNSEKSYSVRCKSYVVDETEETITILQKWSDEHPVMTWIGKLKEAFPGCDAAAMITEACPGWVFGRGPNRFHTDCDGKQTRKCGDCWNGEYKEAAGDG